MEYFFHRKALEQFGRGLGRDVTRRMD